MFNVFDDIETKAANSIPNSLRVMFYIILTNNFYLCADIKKC